MRKSELFHIFLSHDSILHYYVQFFVGFLQLNMVSRMALTDTDITMCKKDCYKVSRF